ncbi:MAG: insulinase family protein [Gemmatimonadota bacterium]
MGGGLGGWGLPAGAVSSPGQFREPGLLTAWARVRETGDLQAASDEMLATLGAVAGETPPTEVEVQRAKTDYLKNIELSFNDPQGIARQLTEWTAMGDWRLFFLHRDRLEQVTPDAVRRVAATYLVPTNRTMGFFYPVDETPIRAEVPSAPDVPTLVADYEGREAVAEGEAFDPSPSNIDSRTERIELANGLELALTPKENRGDAVEASFTFRLGSEAALMGRAAEAGLVGAMLRRGTESRTRQEIEDELDRLKAQVFFGGGPTSLGGSIVTTRENLPAVIRLLGEMLETPSFPESEFATLKQEQLVAIESQMAEPQPRAVTAYQRHLNQWPKDHPLYVPSLEERKERLENATLAEVRQFWTDFYGAQDGTMAIVGDFDPDEIRGVVEEVFGSWTAAHGFERIPDPYRDVAADEVDIETPDKTNAMMIAAQPVQIKDSDDDYPAMELGDYMMGGGFLNSRLATRIRQEEGLSYGVGSSFGAPALDDSGVWLAYAIFAPENADAVVTAFREVVAEVLSEGFAADELEAAKTGYLDSRRNSRTDDGTVAGQLSSQLYLDRTYEFTAEEEAAIRALTVEDVNGAMRRHIDPSKIAIFRAGDFAGAKEAPTS